MNIILKEYISISYYIQKKYQFDMKKQVEILHENLQLFNGKNNLNKKVTQEIALIIFCYLCLKMCTIFEKCETVTHITYCRFQCYRLIYRKVPLQKRKLVIYKKIIQLICLIVKACISISIQKCHWNYFCVTGQ